MKIPKFRNTTRLVRWMNKNHHNERLTADREEVFFKTKKEEPYLVAHNLAQYCWRVGKVEERLENLLKAHSSAVIEYARMCWNRNLGEISKDLKDSLKGHSAALYNLAQLYDSRLEKELEDTFEHPNWAFQYAKDILRGRLPAHLESIFFKDARMASKYAFEVIRGFAPVRLPDDLHSFMIMQSFAHPDDHNIKIYMEASESDPNKMGNSSAVV